MILFQYYHPQGVEDIPSYEKLELNRKNGMFDSLNFDHVGFYVGDYLQGINCYQFLDGNLYTYFHCQDFDYL